MLKASEPFSYRGSKMSGQNTSGADNNFISTLSSSFENVFSNTVNTLGNDVFPRWLGEQFNLESQNGLANPLADNRFFQPFANPAVFGNTNPNRPVAGSTVQQAGIITGTGVGDAIILAGIVGIGLILVLRR